MFLGLLGWRYEDTGSGFLGHRGGGGEKKHLFLCNLNVGLCHSVGEPASFGVTGGSV